MRRLLVLVAALLAVPIAPAAAESASIAAIVADSAAYDSTAVGEITVEGELVGDFQSRGSWVWVQVNGDAYADRALLDGGPHAGSNVGIGARFPAEVFDALGAEAPGGYRVRGAIVAITGEWHHHDPSRGGESWFEVSAAVLVSPEHHLDEPIDWVVLLAGVTLLGVAAVLTFATRRRVLGA